MANIDNISNNEIGQSVRTKLNELIKFQNGFPTLGMEMIVGGGGLYGVPSVAVGLETLAKYHTIYDRGSGNIRGVVTVPNNHTETGTIEAIGANYGNIEIRVTQGATLTFNSLRSIDVSEYQSDNVKAAFLAKNGGTLPVLSGHIVLNDATADSFIALLGVGSFCSLRARSNNTIIDANNISNAVDAIYGGQFNARGYPEDEIIIRNSDNANINCFSLGQVVLNGITFSGAGNFDLNVGRGGRIAAHNCNNVSGNESDGGEIIASGNTIVS